MDSATFWDRIAPKYAQDPIRNQTAYAYTLGRTRSYLTPRDKVIELGCGTGSTALLLADAVAAYTATDVSPKMIDIARAKPKTTPHLQFAVMDGLPDAGTFDAVLAFNLFHLMPDIEAHFARIHALLPAGGIFIQKTACLRRGVKWRAIAAVIPLMQALGKAPYVNRIGPAELDAAVTRAGFDIIESGDHPSPSRYIVARKRG